jgi:hypothetical protein
MIFYRCSTAHFIPRCTGWSGGAGSQPNGKRHRTATANSKYYRLTAKGRKQLLVEESQWKQMTEAVARVMWPAAEES